MTSGRSSASRQNQGAYEDRLRRLMVRYQSADPPAIEELVALLSPVLLRFLSGPHQITADAEDLLQECWMRIHRSRHTYRPSEPLLPWIFAIARHTRLDGYRRRRRLESRETLVSNLPEERRRTGAVEVPDPAVFELLDHLPEGQREVILMLKVSGMSLEEVAQATSSTVGGIKQKAHRAYAKLRLLLEKDQANASNASHKL
jgi:RNA polymerase sigma-70 factor (ECF subfamily)